MGLTVADPWPIPRRSNAAGGVTLERRGADSLCGHAPARRRGGEQRVISDESARAMRSVQAKADYTHDRGLAWQLHSIGDLKVVEHGGATNGFMARLVLIPERNYAIVVLTNGEYGSSVHGAVVAQAIEDRFGAKEAARVRVTPVGRTRWQRFTGTYAHKLADSVITVDDDGLVMKRIGHNPFSGASKDLGDYRLSPLSETVFIVEDGSLEGSIGELFLDEDGSVRFLRFGGRLGYPV